MKKAKINYSVEIFRAVITIYGTRSQIYRDMMGGKAISGLIWESIRKKGSDYRIKDKKKLYKACKELEEFFQRDKTDRLGL